MYYYLISFIPSTLILYFYYQKIQRKKKLLIENMESIEEWELYEEKSFQQKSTASKMHADIQKLSDLIFRSIKIYGSDMTGIAALAKDLTIDICFTMTENNDKRRIIRQQLLPNNKKCYLILNMDKHTRIYRLGACITSSCNKNIFIFDAKFTILIPKNKLAEKKCNEFINDKIDIKLENNLRNTSQSSYRCS